jgi:hypothetical protein
MRKEVLYAVIFGIILGGIILFGINLANNSVNNPVTTEESTPSAKNITPTPTQVTNKTFDLLLPEDHSVIIEDITLLKGIAEPLSTVAVITESSDYLLDVSPEGTFSAQINLIPGANAIKVVQAGIDNTTKSISISVIQQTTLPE